MFQALWGIAVRIKGLHKRVSIQKHVLYPQEASAFISMTTFPLFPKILLTSTHRVLRGDQKWPCPSWVIVWTKQVYAYNTCAIILISSLLHLTCMSLAWFSSIYNHLATTDRPSHMFTNFKQRPTNAWGSQAPQMSAATLVKQWQFKVSVHFRSFHVHPGGVKSGWGYRKWIGNHKGKIHNMGGGWEWNGEKRDKAPIYVP